MQELLAFHMEFYACMVAACTLLIIHHAQIPYRYQYIIILCRATAASCHYESIYYYACGYIAMRIAIQRDSNETQSRIVLIASLHDGNS